MLSLSLSCGKMSNMDYIGSGDYFQNICKCEWDNWFEKDQLN